MNYDQVHATYMQEVKDYLAKVANGRRVGHVNPQDRRFNQNSEDQRQAHALGVPYTSPPQATAPYSQALSPQYGFTPTPRPAWAPYADQVGKALGDPRMSALMAPGMSLLKAPGAAYRAGQALHGALQNERGSFNPGGGSFSMSQKELKDIQGLNQAAARLEPRHPSFSQGAQDELTTLGRSPEPFHRLLADDIRDTARGRQALEAERDSMYRSTSGGADPQVPTDIQDWLTYMKQQRGPQQ